MVMVGQMSMMISISNQHNGQTLTVMDMGIDKKESTQIHVLMILEIPTQIAKVVLIPMEMVTPIQTTLGTQITGQMPLKMTILNGLISMVMDLVIIGVIVHGQTVLKTGQAYSSMVS